MSSVVKRSHSFGTKCHRKTMCRSDTRVMASVEASWPVPMKAIGAQNLLTMPGGVTISGYLHKKGGTQLQLLRWPLRFVIIHKGCVYYFKSSTSAYSQGAFSLNGYNRVMRAAEETTSNNVFPFKLVHISKKHRTWYFSASSEDERKKWMSSLRKEIDFYNEKKETVTDLSDSDSETDSFYGQVERPVAIAYNQSTADSEGSLQGYDDEDDIEEDYLQPDQDDPANSSFPPPNYPPPPPPSLSHSQRMLSFNVPTKPQPPLPPPKKTSIDELLLRRESPSLTPPQVNVPRTVMHSRKSGPPPVVPPITYPRHTTTDKRTSNLSPSARPVLGNPNSYTPSAKDLGSVLKSMNVSPQFPTPVPPAKPKMLPTPSVPPAVPVHSKPALFKPEVLPKPPPPKAADRVKKLTLEIPAVSQLQSSPDGQSFRELTCEKQRPLPQGTWSTSHDEVNSSDEDYEKVHLPLSVFVNTSESAEVERLMKGSSATSCPLDGMYCIRNSTKSGKVLVVWDNECSKMRNYRIFEKGSKFYLEECYMFSGIWSLVEHYHTHILPSHDTLILKHPYGYTRPR
ncbi:SH3 domain-binding protein 2 isoform X2 [Ambystoma mexicanum]|uniref:SH3 domain-binding protein 2 isoform X2 n=1 Tax=Ambystoma mexicanum TaxID=8296 RepID=UPI0037E9B232